METAEALLNLYGEAFEETQLLKVSCNGTEDEVFIRTLMVLDPFFMKCDILDNVKTTEDLGENEPRLVKGEYGDFCPVVLNKDSWLFPGSGE